MRRLPLLAILAAVAFLAGLSATTTQDHPARLIGADEELVTTTTVVDDSPSTTLPPTTSTTVVEDAPLTTVPGKPDGDKDGGPEPDKVPEPEKPKPAGPSTTLPRPQKSSQQWYIKMVCGLADDGVVVCEWAKPPVNVTDWHVVRRLPGTDEVGIPTTSERYIVDPTAEPHTTYTYVLNGYDGDRSVVLASAKVTTDECCSTGLDGQ